MKARRCKRCAARAAGFTLVELMVVISILGLLSGIVAMSVGRAGVRAKQTKVRVDTQVLENAIVLFHQDTSQWPEDLDDLVRGASADWQGPYVANGRAATIDPWNRKYVYERAGSGDRPFRLGSYGADGRAGGEGEDMDIFRPRE